MLVTEMRQFARHLSLLLTLMLAGGCTGLRTGGDSLRLLVQFNEPVPEPAAPALIDELERETGAKVYYLQSLGLGIHVYQLEGRAAVLTQAAARLSARADIRSVQPDHRRLPLEGTRAGTEQPAWSGAAR